MKKIILVLLAATIIAVLVCGCSDVKSLSFGADTYTIYVDEVFAPDVKIKPAKSEYNFSVANEVIAKVTDDGKIKGLVEGITEITVTSGKKKAKSRLIVVYEQENKPGNDPVIAKNITVSFEIVNYADYGLKTGVLSPHTVVEGSILNVGTPVVPAGFVPDYFYTDRACRQKFDENTRIYDSMTLYLKISPLETSYNVIDGLIVGLLYKNLPHENLVLPENMNGGEEIIGIADEAFYCDEEIKTVQIPKSYRTVGSSAFAGCTSLERVTFERGSKLENIGVNAFGVGRDENGKIVSACEKLSEMNVPEGVRDVGAFAFYRCKRLELDGIFSVKILNQYAFAETAIKAVDLENVSLIYEGAFMNCAALERVENAHNVVKCSKYAFDGTKLASDARRRYENEDRLEPGMYADTILFGISPQYGRGLGSGKYRIREETTLIADGALNGQKQSELTLYIDTDNARTALDSGNYFIGDGVFYKKDDKFPKGIFIVTPEELYDRYVNKYNAADRDYSSLFCVEEILSVGSNPDDNNYGRHVLLYRGGQYSYDRFIPFEDGTPYVIKVDTLGAKRGATVSRINMNAFTGIPTLRALYLNNVVSVAYNAVTGCSELKSVYFIGSYNSITVAQPEDPLALVFADDGKIYVPARVYENYRSVWYASSYYDLYKKLTKYE